MSAWIQSFEITASSWTSITEIVSIEIVTDLSASGHLWRVPMNTWGHIHGVVCTSRSSLFPLSRRIYQSTYEVVLVYVPLRYPCGRNLETCSCSDVCLKKLSMSCYQRKSINACTVRQRVMNRDQRSRKWHRTKEGVQNIAVVLETQVNPWICNFPHVEVYIIN